MHNLLNVSRLSLPAVAILWLPACMGDFSDSNNSTQGVANKSTSVSTPMFVACAGQVASSSVTSTDINPPTWTWSRCDIPNPSYRVGLDNPCDLTVTTTTSFTPAQELYVGQHTLYVSQLKSDGTWSPLAGLTMTLMPRARRGSVSMADPNLDSTALYAYPIFNGNTVAPGRLEVSDANGFHPDDILQGDDLGDCYYVATLAAISAVKPFYLNSLVKPLVDGYGDPVVDNQNYPLYQISMYTADANGNTVPWTFITDLQLPVAQQAVDGDYDMYGARPSADGFRVKIGIPLLEKGFAALDQNQNFLNTIGGDYSDSLGAYHQIGNGGWPVWSFLALAGNYSQNATMANVSQNTLLALVQSQNTAMALSFDSGYFVPASSLPSGATVAMNNDGDYVYQPADGAPAITLFDDHCYSLVSMQQDGTVRLRNPWGGDWEAGSDDGEFNLPFADLGSLFYLFTAAVIPGS